MNDSELHPLAGDYLKRLKKISTHLPRARRIELLDEIAGHLREALPAGASEAEAREVLERLGEPEQIVAEAAPEGEPPRAGLREWLAIPLLLLGGFVVLIGWFVGATLLWDSKVWTLRDKLIGTLILPGGLLPIVLLLTITTTTCSGSSGTRTNPETGRLESFSTSTCPHHSTVHTALSITAVTALIVLPILTSIYLGQRANRLRTAAS
jgi:hypothetical protein